MAARLFMRWKRKEGGKRMVKKEIQRKRREKRMREKEKEKDEGEMARNTLME